MKTIYVHVRHSLFWYGVYGFCDKSRNDEITLYSDKEKHTFLGYFDLNTQASLTYVLNHELDRNENKEFCDEIEEFLNSDLDVGYSYIYPRDEEDLSDQVPHLAPINSKGHKPIYIYVWSKLSRDWDMNSIEDIIKILAKDFFHLNIEQVEFLNIPPYEETKASFEMYYKRHL